MKACSILDEYRQRQDREEVVAGVQSEGRWKRPIEGRIKVNTDAGSFTDGGGLGVVIRDHAGRFLLAAAKKIRGVPNPELNEALAAELGLQLVIQHRLGVPILELDCLTVVKSIREAETIHTELGTICQSIRRLLDSIPGGSIEHVSRKANEAAHIMAHSETRWNMAEVWFDRPPIFLVDQLRLDDVVMPINQ
ncbi:unnamed protein product [Linum tenue]|uniref:RNase H type-1 domain-containing protein n=1 Tax=Linum tenue TaxID=586396 RepID=A0AAV0KIZ3_9ROSI|nr:unnamed protein product [Linum tenue]